MIHWVIKIHIIIELKPKYSDIKIFFGNSLCEKNISYSWNTWLIEKTQRKSKFYSQCLQVGYDTWIYLYNSSNVLNPHKPGPENYLITVLP